MFKALLAALKLAVVQATRSAYRRAALVRIPGND